MKLTGYISKNDRKLMRDEILRRIATHEDAIKRLEKRLKKAGDEGCNLKHRRVR